MKYLLFKLKFNFCPFFSSCQTVKWPYSAWLWPRQVIFGAVIGIARQGGASSQSVSQWPCWPPSIQMSSTTRTELHRTSELSAPTYWQFLFAFHNDNSATESLFVLASVPKRSIRGKGGIQLEAKSHKAKCRRLQIEPHTATSTQVSIGL